MLDIQSEAHVDEMIDLLYEKMKVEHPKYHDSIFAGVLSCRLKETLAFVEGYSESAYKHLLKIWRERDNDEL